MRRVRHAEERLDEAVHDPRELRQSLDQVAAVNRWLGGTRAVLRTLPRLLPPDGPLRVLDVGCGSGDVAAALAHQLRARGRAVRVTVTDLHPQVLGIARERLGALPDFEFARVDARALPFRAAAFDVALMSLTLHHFEDDEPVAVLRELARVARAIVVNDLERNRANYLGARLLAATLWAGNRLTRHDGPLSVRRAFTPGELHDLAVRAGLADVEVRRRFFYRVVLSAHSA